jgi:hypothetical protein
MKNRKPDTPRPIPDFTPVPRRYRCDGWTPERQRAFVAALAETGSVKHAAERINMASEGAYALRRQPGAEGFRAAWEAALDFGVQRLVDVALERAIDGVPVPIMYQGEQVAERRQYNDRLLMFILRHHLPHRYGPLKPLAPGTKHPDTLAREAAEASAAAMARGASVLRGAIAVIAEGRGEEAPTDAAVIDAIAGECGRLLRVADTDENVAEAWAYLHRTLVRKGHLPACPVEDNCACGENWP